MVVVLVSVDGKPAISRNIAACDSVEKLVIALEECLSLSHIRKEIEYYDNITGHYLLLEDVTHVFNSTQPKTINIFTQNTCTKHKNEELQFLCTNHFTICCAHCFLLGEHKGCQLKPINESRDLCEAKFKNAKLSQIPNTLEKNIKIVTASEERVALLQKEYERRIDDEFDKTMEMLKEKKSQMKMEIARELQENLNSLTNYRKEQENNKERIEKCVAVFSSYCNDISDWDIVESVSTIFATDFRPGTQLKQFTSFSMEVIKIPDTKITKLFTDIPIEPIAIERAGDSKKAIQENLFIATKQNALFLPIYQPKQFYKLQIAGSRFEKEGMRSLDKLYWNVRKAPHRNTDNGIYLLMDGAIAQVLSVHNNWLELKNGFTSLVDMDRGNVAMWNQITSWTLQLAEMNAIIPGCHSRVTSMLAISDKYLGVSPCNSNASFMTQIAAILIKQFNCTIFGGFVRDYIFRNTEPSNLDVAIPGTSFDSFLASFASYLQGRQIQMETPSIENNVATTSLTMVGSFRSKISFEVLFVITDNIIGAPSVDFDVNNFQLTTFGANSQPILFQRANILKSNSEIVRNIKAKKCEIAKSPKLELASYKTHLQEHRIPKMKNRGWTITNQNAIFAQQICV